MSNYSPITNFAALDALASGNPSKAAKGASITAELNAIAVAIATKYDPAILAAAAQILFGNGSAGSPSIAFNAYTNTGLYAAAANSLGFSANGVSAGNISSTGKWTIPAPSSGVALTVNGVANFDTLDLVAPNTAGQSFGQLITAGTNTSDYALIARNVTGSQNYLYIQGDGQNFIFAPTAATDKSGTNLYQAGFMDVPQNLNGGNYTLVMSDRGKHIYDNGSVTDTKTIPANASVAFPIGTTITFVNRNNAAITLAIAGGDALLWAPSLAAGSRTLGVGAVATILKIASTIWVLTGVGIS